MIDVRRHTRRVLIGTVGSFVSLVGLILVPYPGPGWLIVFGGLAILATEFEFASRWLEFAKGKYDQWAAWLQSQNIFVRILVLGATGLVIVVTLWLFNAFGIINNFFNLGYDWLKSPLFK
ncbi:MAG: TIGR02611 family protein [Candidatus Microsaccharimonas sp.]